MFDWEDLVRAMPVAADDLPARLAEIPQADRIGQGLRTLCETHAEILENPENVDVFISLAAQGQYPQNVLLTDPEAIAEIAATRRIALDTDQLGERLDVLLGPAPHERELFEALRRFKRRESLRTFLREVDGVASVRQTTAEIANIAETCLDRCVTHCARIAGYPELAKLFCVLGMGKLGGRELNFSSDVDLIYICSDQVDPTWAPRMDALARAVTAAMEANTQHGYVFRVDLRLRPEGTQGALVQPVSAVADYYSSWGRTWERSAMIKARPVAGNRSLGDGLLKALEPFIYRKYLDFSAIDELRAMKENINRNAQLSAIVGEKAEAAPIESAGPANPLKNRLKAKIRSFGNQGKRPRISRTEAQPPIDETELLNDTSGVLGWNVKIGIGGIREIEFFVQALQLVHCGVRPALRVRTTLEALDRMLYSGLINHDDHSGLADAYAFFRRVEHRVQMENDRQGHRLPLTRAGIEMLASRMESSVETLWADIVRHRDTVQSMFSRLFAESAQAADKPTIDDARPGAVETVLGSAVDAGESTTVLDALSSLGFSRPRQVAGQIAILRGKTYGPFSERAGLQNQEFARYVLENAAAAPNADQAFSFLTRFFTLVGDRPGYFDMLRENPHATRLLIHVFGSSQYLAGALIKEPAIFQRLLGAGSVAITRTRAGMQGDLAERLARIEDPSHRIGVIRRFHQEETLRIGLHETGGAATIRTTNEQLSLLAETVIAAVCKEVYEPLRTRRRRPGSILPPLDEIPFVVVAMGKLGGRELGFGSDLDIIFLYQDDRQWRLEHSFYARLAQRLVRTLSSAGGEGKMYEVDTRLRPSGQQGALVVSVEAFQAYHEERAELWERQALLRARPILGPTALCEEFETTRIHFAFERELPADAYSQIFNMADRIRESTLEHGHLDVKFSRGGLVDLEFLSQFLQLAVAQHDPAPGLRSPNTYVALEALEASPAVARQFPKLDIRSLRQDYGHLRTVEARLRMVDHRGQSALPTDLAEVTTLARRMGYQGDDAGESMVLELGQVMERIRSAVDSLAG